jgi:hypothetical protein
MSQTAALLPAMQLRVSMQQRTYLLMLAERQNCSVSEAVRRLIDTAIDNEPPYELEDSTNTMKVRRLLEIVDHKNVEPDPAWLRAYRSGE